jgi:hypothetical protein
LLPRSRDWGGCSLSRPFGPPVNSVSTSAASERVC